MVRLILSGDHTLLSFDTVVELIAGVIALLIVVAAIRYGRLAKDKRYNALGAGFFFIFLSFLAEIITTTLLWWQFRQGCCVKDIYALAPILLAGHAAMHLLFVAGLIVLVIWALKLNDYLQRALVVVLGLFVAITGIWDNTIAHLFSLILLSFVTVKYLLNAQSQSSHCAWEVFTAFALITFAHLAFLLEPACPTWYIGGHVAQLVGYGMLLVVLLQVIRK
jgi:hypothetical protein